MKIKIKTDKWNENYNKWIIKIIKKKLKTEEK